MEMMTGDVVPVIRSTLLTITDPSRVGDARREAASFAQELGFSEAQAGKVGIVVTEAAKNVVKHAHQGWLVLRRLQRTPVSGLEIIAIDKGPGMADISRCMADGYSTAGSPGTGLGAMSRLSDLFDIHSDPGKGTVLVSRIWARPSARITTPLDLGVICVPSRETDACGDAWTVRHDADRSQVLVVDGLGHGDLAARAADEAVRVFQEKLNSAPGELVRQMHGPLRSTRGASLAVAEIDRSGRALRYAGVGNISGFVWDQGSTRSMVSHNGTVGHELHRVQEFSYPWSQTAMLVMHSDGLTSRWKFDGCEGLIGRHPAVIAGVLFRDFHRGGDDATVLVIRQSET